MSYRHIANLTGPPGDQGDKGDPGDQGDKGDPGDKGAPGIGSHGVLSEPTDMDELRTSDDMGTRTARGQNILNGPPIDDNTLTTIEVIWNASNGVTQRITTAREVWHRNAIGNDSFFAWQRSVASETVGRIITSKDAEHPLEDGDLLVLIDTPSYFTDFSDQTPGDQPRDWSTQWVGGDYAVEFDPAASNGIVLAHPGSAEDERRGFSWDLLDGAIEEGMIQEIAFKWRGGADTQPRVVAQGSGAEGSETGYFGGVWAISSSSAVGSFDDGSATSFSGEEGDTDHTAGDWWITRFRLEPEIRLMVRSWRAGAPEPSGWSREVSISSAHPQGWTGILAWGSGWTQYDWFGVALDGGRAPVGV